MVDEVVTEKGTVEVTDSSEISDAGMEEIGASLQAFRDGATDDYPSSDGSEETVTDEVEETEETHTEEVEGSEEEVHTEETTKPKKEESTSLKVLARENRKQQLQVKKDLEEIRLAKQELANKEKQLQQAVPVLALLEKMKTNKAQGFLDLIKHAGVDIEEVTAAMLDEYENKTNPVNKLSKVEKELEEVKKAAKEKEITELKSQEKKLIDDFVVIVNKTFEQHLEDFPLLAQADNGLNMVMGVITNYAAETGKVLEPKQVFEVVEEYLVEQEKEKNSEETLKARKALTERQERIKAAQEKKYGVLTSGSPKKVVQEEEDQEEETFSKPSTKRRVNPYSDEALLAGAEEIVRKIQRQ